MAYPSALFKRQAPEPEGFVPFDPQEIEGSIGRRFEQTVRLHGNRLAYEDDAGRRMTYAELNAAVNRMVHRVLDRRTQEKNQTAVLLFGRSAGALIGSLAMIKAGWVAVGIDPEAPLAHQQELVADSEADLLITDSAHLDQARALGSGRIEIINIDEIEAGDEANPDFEVGADDYGFIFYSSGSTGKPKGIIHSHRSALHLICYLTERYRFHPGDRVPFYLNLGTATILLRVYAPLLTGGTVLPFDLKAQGIEQFVDFYRDYRLTLIACNATLYRQFMQQMDESRPLPDLRLLSLGGEGLRSEDMTLYRQWFNQRALGLTYGTTEALWVTNSFISDANEIDGSIAPTCGYAFGQHEVLLVDEHRQPVPEGEVGEFAVRSRFLSPGYWRQPELTEAAFYQDGDDPELRVYLTGDMGRRIEGGLHFHLGRKDDQVQVRGFRVEPGEIESALLRIDGVREAAVVGRADHRGEMRLIAYVVGTAESTLREDDVRNRLRESLPDQYMPARVVFLDEMPRTDNVKIDRKKLPDPQRERPALHVPYAEPRTELEAAVAAIWAEELDLEAVGIHDLFFDLGGHSMLATQLIARVSEAFGLHVSHEVLFDAPTVAQMAAALDALVGETGEDGKGRIDAVPREGRQMKQTGSGELTGGSTGREQ